MYEEEYGDDQAAAEEAAYQEMCEAGADFEKEQMEAEGEVADAESNRLQEMNDALDKGAINKNPLKRPVWGKDKVTKI